MTQLAQKNIFHSKNVQNPLISTEFWVACGIMILAGFEPMTPRLEAKHSTAKLMVPH